MQCPVSKFRFGSFELDCASGELRKHGLRLKLEDQPFRVLVALVQNHGQVVDREALKSELWAHDTYGDFDHGLTRAVNRVRSVLGDSAANPLFLETLPRRGYRFVAPVTQVEGDSAAQVADQAPVPIPPIWRLNRWAYAALAMLAAVLAFGATIALRRGTSVPISSIAVLPFEGVTPDQNYFGDGMTDQLIATLSRYGSLRVVSHKSVLHYRNTRKKLSDIAGELKVDALVDGSVSQAGQRIRVNARLIQFPNERTVWAKTFDRNIADFFTLQSDLSQNIAGEIGLATIPSRQGFAAPIDPALHALYVKGRFLANEPRRESIELGIQTLEQVVAKDPGYAPAYAALAKGWFGMSSTFLKPTDAMPQAKAAARKAIELDPNSDSAHAVLGLIHLYYDWDWTATGRQFDQALALNPSNADSMRGLACLRLTTGHEKLSIEAADRAMLLEPMSLWAHHLSAIMLTFTGHTEAAEKRARAALDWEPGFGLTRSILGMIYLDRGKKNEGIRELERAVQSQKIPTNIAFLALGYARVGRTREAQKLLDDLVATGSRQYLCAFEIALAYAALGQMDTAFTWMRRALAERADCVVLIRSEPWVEPLRSDPRYAALIKDIGFPAP